MPLSNRLAAEFFGIFWLVLGGCAVLAAAFPGQVIGAIAATGVLYLIASGKAGFDLSGYGEHSPGGWALSQQWLFWVAPLLGAAAAGVVYRLVSRERGKAAGIEGPAGASQLEISR